MNLFKFLSLLSTRTLRFARSDTFEDKWEGLSRAIRYSPPKEVTLAEKIYADSVSEHDNWRRQQMKKSIFVSCWTQAQESIPMWNLFGS